MSLPELTLQAYRHAQIGAQKICEPLFNTTPISDLYFAREFPNGDIMGVNTNVQCFEDMYLEFPELLIPKNRIGPKDGFFLSASTNPIEAVVLSRKHNKYHGLSYIKTHKQYIDHIAFASNIEDTRVIEFYINHLDVLKEFIQYFLEKVEPLLQDPNLILRFPESLYQNKPLLETIDLDRSQLEFSHSAHTILTKSLSNKEKICFELLLKGYTREEMASYMHISASSVGSYLARIMKKLHCHSRAELINYAIEHNLLKVNTR